MNNSVEISVIVPVFNEESVLNDFCRKLISVLISLDMSYEIIFIDDGSKDSSWEIISRFGNGDRCIRGIRFTRNFGQQVALSAGFDMAQGDAVICMDADLQHPPELIPKMIQLWRQGNKIVNTTREDGKLPIFKKWGTLFFYKILSVLSDTPILESSPDFRCMDREVVESFRSLRERDRFLRGLVSWMGYPSTTISFRAPAQNLKKSRYTLKKMLHLAIDALTSFTAFPLRLAFYFGLFTSFSSAIYAAYTLYIKFFSETAVKGWTSLIIVLLFLGGNQMIFLGIIGEYIYRIYNEVKKRPLYIKRDKINFSEYEMRVH